MFNPLQHYCLDSITYHKIVHYHKLHMELKFALPRFSPKAQKIPVSVPWLSPRLSIPCHFNFGFCAFLIAPSLCQYTQRSGSWHCWYSHPRTNSSFSFLIGWFFLLLSFIKLTVFYCSIRCRSFYLVSFFPLLIFKPARLRVYSTIQHSLMLLLHPSYNWS